MALGRDGARRLYPGATLRIEPGPDLEAPALLLMRLSDKQAHAIKKAYGTAGRVTDQLIGQPRKSRTAKIAG